MWMSALLQELNSSVFVLIIVLVAVFWCVYHLGGLMRHWQIRDDDLRKLREDWNRDIPPIKARLDLVFQQLTPSSTIKSDSPVRLTATGEKISLALDAPKILEMHGEKLIHLIAANAPQNAYDMQQACFAVVERSLTGMLSDDTLNAAKNEAFQHGIPLDNVLAVVAVLLRDRLIKEKGWSLAAVDTHAS